MEVNAISICLVFRIHCGIWSFMRHELNCNRCEKRKTNSQKRFNDTRKIHLKQHEKNQLHIYTLSDGATKFADFCFTDKWVSVSLSFICSSVLNEKSERRKKNARNFKRIFNICHCGNKSMRLRNAILPANQFAYQVRIKNRNIKRYDANRIRGVTFHIVQNALRENNSFD